MRAIENTFCIQLQKTDSNKKANTSQSLTKDEVNTIQAAKPVLQVYKKAIKISFSRAMMRFNVL
jgi:hypothetical protein